MSNFVNLLDIVYPVGSVYITFSDISPVDSVGGSWEKIEDKFLYATSTPNQTGGSLKHSHKYGLTYTMWWFSIGSFSDEENWILPLLNWNENGNRTSHTATKVSENNTFVNSSLNIGGVVSKNANDVYENIAQSEYVSTLPPYITCNMYKRIA